MTLKSHIDFKKKKQTKVYVSVSLLYVYNIEYYVGRLCICIRVGNTFGDITIQLLRVNVAALPTYMLQI